VSPRTDPPIAQLRHPLPRLTGRVFTDLAIWMMGLGLLMGVAFPFFVMAFGVPADYVLTPVFFLATTSAGLAVGASNQFLSRVVVGSRLRFMRSRMAAVEQNLRSGSFSDDAERGTPEMCTLPVDSDDELGGAALSFNHLVEALTASQHRLQQLAAIDALTGLLNRRFGLDRLNEQFARAVCCQEALGIILFDIDRFKAVNDTFGHHAGDRVLKAVADAAHDVLRDGDTLMRYGGEEFLAVLPGADLAEVEEIGERGRGDRHQRSAPRAGCHGQPRCGRLSLHRRHRHRRARALCRRRDVRRQVDGSQPPHLRRGVDRRLTARPCAPRTRLRSVSHGRHGERLVLCALA
jgi:diguanylate cyclase (GGDEF)-like protein